MRKETIGNATLYLGDCLTILPELRADAVVTDPPYGIGWDANYQRFKPSGVERAKKLGQNEYRAIQGDAQNFNPAPWLSFPLVVMFGANHFKSLLPDGGSWLVWDKRRPDGTYFVSQAELAWCSKDGAVNIFSHCWQGFARASENSQHFHPTQKPIALMKWCMDRIGDAKTILDPYMGSGPTGIAALQDGRKFIGVEIEPSYFDIACERIENAQRQERLFA